MYRKPVSTARRTGKRFARTLLCTSLAAAISAVAQAQMSETTSESETSTVAAKRPNLLVILADDLGYTDLGAYGSEIKTPNLDDLAQQGLRFSKYRTAPSCAPTRAMLMSGVDSHRAGVANIAEALTPAQSHSPFYQGHLRKDVVTIATQLKDAGYHTYMAGKWHLGYKDPALRPINRGFEQTVMMPYSGGDNWSDKSYLPLYEKTLWFENGEPFELPEDFYSSEFLVDKAIAQIDSNRADGKPFFTYLPFMAVHLPMQAPREYTQKYLETYRHGWDPIRSQRQQAAKAIGLVPADAAMKRMNTTAEWGALPEEEQRYNAKRMAVYAGMIDAMDAHIGRLLQYLKDIGEYDNTVIVFTSDNGPEPNEVTGPQRLLMLNLLDYTDAYETLGEKGSYGTIGPSFASAAAAPLGHYKFHSGEGGMRVPLVVSGPAVADVLRGQISHATAYVKDLAPTLLELAGVADHRGQYRGRTVEPITGRSLRPLLEQPSTAVYGPEDTIAYEIGGNAALIKGDYKITFNRGPNNDGQWHLYHIERDPGETTPLEQQKPARFAELLSDYETYVRDNGVLPVPPDYNQRRQVTRNAVRQRLPQIAFAAGLLLAGVATLLLWRRRRRG
ncbi:sulfatase-like hydrolase/transferase [Microbulbifer agarilyticus]